MGEYRWVFGHVGFFSFSVLRHPRNQEGGPMEKRDPSVAVPILLIADSDVRRRRELRRFFSGSGFLVAAVADGLGCLAELVALEADVLVIALEIPVHRDWRLNERHYGALQGLNKTETARSSARRRSSCGGEATTSVRWPSKRTIHDIPGTIRVTGRLARRRFPPRNA